jgi:hypothetical protein
MVATRAKRDEISQVERCAAVRYGLGVVYLEPLAARAADGAALAVAPECGLAPSVASAPFREWLSTPGSLAARRCRERSRSHFRHGPRRPSTAGSTAAPHLGQSRRMVMPSGGAE